MSDSLTSVKFWDAVWRRCVRTGAQYVLTVLGLGVAAGQVAGEKAEVINALALDYTTLGGAFLGGMLASLLFSLASPPPESRA